VIEAQCLGTPVLGARIGGIPELIEEGVTGMTFESRNKEDLRMKIESMMQHPLNYEMIAGKGQELYIASSIVRREKKLGVRIFRLFFLDRQSSRMC
jgi:glycosyltransferase involved in cell wall biosynthesis